jgi:hypothetical protein
LRQLALVTLLAVGSCEFAQKHPAVTAGITGASVGFLGCEVDSVDVKVCAIVGGSAGAFLGGIAALATLLFETNDTEPAQVEGEQEMTQGGAIRVHTHTAPPPVEIDAGVAADAGPPDVAPDVSLPPSTQPPPP